MYEVGKRSGIFAKGIEIVKHEERNGKFIEHPLLPNMKNYVTKSAHKDQKLIEDFNARLDSFVKDFKKKKV